jgi:hypothetical protein
VRKLENLTLYSLHSQGTKARLESSIRSSLTQILPLPPKDLKGKMLMDPSKALLAQQKPTDIDQTRPPTMITRFITEVNTKFNPFMSAARSTRLFLSSLPPNARNAGGMKINTKLLPRTSTEAPSLMIKFST